MGKAKKTRAFAVAKKMISKNDARLKSNVKKAEKQKEKAEAKEAPRQIDEVILPQKSDIRVHANDSENSSVQDSAGQAVGFLKAHSSFTAYTHSQLRCAT